MKLFPVVLAVVAMGCGGLEAAPKFEVPDTSFGEPQASSPWVGSWRLTANPNAGRVELDRSQHGQRSRTVATPISGGRFDLSRGTDGALSLDRFVAHFGEVTIGPDALPPKGVTLADCHLWLERPATARVLDDGRLELRGTLLFSGSLRTSSGATSPFETQRFENSVLRITREVGVDGVERLRLEHAHEGTVFAWAGLLEVRDGQLELQASRVD